MAWIYLAAIFMQALVAHLGSTTPAAAYIDHPWCTGGGGWSGALTCSFVMSEALPRAASSGQIP
jgi:hypothetical protein